MGIYIDLIYIVNCILGCFCLLSLSILVGKIISIKKCIFLSLFWGMHIITLYTQEWYYILWALILCRLFSKKRWVRNTILFLFIHETYMNSFVGVGRIGNVLIITENFDWLGPLIIGGIILAIYLGLMFQFRKDALYQHLVYDVILNINGKQMKMKGFLDTGNQAVYEGLPIIFLKMDILDYDFISTVQELNMVKQYKLKKGEIYFKNQWNPCVFATMHRLDIQEDCLLNYYLL